MKEKNTFCDKMSNSRLMSMGVFSVVILYPKVTFIEDCTPKVCEGAYIVSRFDIYIFCAEDLSDLVVKFIINLRRTKIFDKK